MRIILLRVSLLLSICLVHQLKCKSLHRKPLQSDQEYEYVDLKMEEIFDRDDSLDSEILTEEKLEYISLILYPDFLAGVKNSQDEDDFQYQCIEFCNMIYNKMETVYKCINNCTENTDVFVKPFKGNFKD
jgi:hypothetical protein